MKQSNAEITGKFIVTGVISVDLGGAKLRGLWSTLIIFFCNRSQPTKTLHYCCVVWDEGAFSSRLFWLSLSKFSVTTPDRKWIIQIKVNRSVHPYPGFFFITKYQEKMWPAKRFAPPLPPGGRVPIYKPYGYVLLWRVRFSDSLVWDRV